MKDRWLGYVPAALLAALAGLTYWLDQQVQPMPPGRTGEGKSPDFLVEDLVATRMKTDGSPRYAVKAKKLVKELGGVKEARTALNACRQSSDPAPLAAPPGSLSWPQPSPQYCYRLPCVQVSGDRSCLGN